MRCTTPLFYRKMRVLGLTGGIATGKTTSGRLFEQLCGDRLVLFDADACVRDLYTRAEVLELVRLEFGEKALCADGALDRDWMRVMVFRDENLRKCLQSIVHPLVRKECLARRDEAKQYLGAALFIADVPLLFEGGFDFGQDANLVVAISRETQEKRLIMRDGFDAAIVHAILEAQLPISHKVKCADVVLWNEGPPSVLKAQIKRFIKNLEYE